MSTSDTTKGSLCSSCESLNLSIAKFQPRESQVQPSDLGHDVHGLERVDLGFLDDIYRRRRSCPFCRLVYLATHKHDGRGIGNDGLSANGDRVACALDWHLDAREETTSSTGPQNNHRKYPLTRRLRVFNTNNLFSSAYIVPFVSTDPVPDKPSFFGRTVDPHRVNENKIRQWLRTCEEHHSLCSHSLSYRKEIGEIRVIDTQELCLVQKKTPFRYCTLSYLWGAPQSFVTHLREDNVDDWRVPGAFGRIPLPKTVSDCISLAAALGERYLWIDGWCIVQASREDWTHFAPLMDSIYGDSVLTICAASGANSNVGLPGLETTPRDLVQHVERVSGVDLVVLGNVEDTIARSAWNTRAWTFQERILSRRCLIFVDNRIYFQCRQTTWNEELDSESPHSTWSLDSVGSPLNIFKENPLRQYARCVEMYSGRLLTVVTDKLIAFAGISACLAALVNPETSRDSFLLFGLLVSHFDWSLLWDVKVKCRRTVSDRYQESSTPGRQKFPSWSWCGWEGTSYWRVSSTAGVLNQLHEWLVHHTWIIWYRSAETDHDLVSHAVTKPANRTSRWDGYFKSAEGDVHDPSLQQGDAYGRVRTRPCQTDDTFPTRPTQPPTEGALHFWTWSAHFSLSRRNPGSKEISSPLDPSLHRFGVTDRNGDWCGTIVLDDTYFSHVEEVFEFIAISDARDFSLEEYDSWTYYTPAEREQAEWYLYYALMIKKVRMNERDVYERIGLAKIYHAAFHSASFEPGLNWKEITLA